MPSERTLAVLAHHARQPGCTARAFERSGSYALLAAHARGRVLDLGCGNRLVVPGAIGLDLSLPELLHGTGHRVQGRADQLPFATASFETVTCHLAFMLFDEPSAVVAELQRVLVPGGRFVALLGGGPRADGDDAFAQFVAQHAPRLPGRSPALTEPRWRELFARWSHVAPFERHVLDCSGPLDEVRRFLATTYGAPAQIEPTSTRCFVAVYVAIATR